MESAESLSCLICVFSYLINYSDGLTYIIPEELPRLKLIGNIAKDEDIRSLVSESDYNSLEFHFLNLDNPYLKHFSIDSSSSDLRIGEPLDWEVICEFSTTFSCPVTLDVAAQSKTGTFFKKISITIFLEDINDHSPIFDPPYFSFSISESEVQGKSIALNTAQDIDSANFSVQSYEVIPAEIPFRADFLQNSDGPSQLNLVLTDKLDREITDNYYFMLIARDGGTPSLNGTMMINVTIEDDNDNRPVFQQSVYQVRVKEDYPLNVTFLNVTATDLDIGRNAKISYHLNSQQSQAIKDTYDVDPETGEVFLKKHLEYVSNEAIKVKIDAVDNGERPLTSQTTIEVTVEDSENNAPVIKINLLSNSQTAEAREYASFGSVVAYVEVIDKDGDRNGRVSCEVESGPFGMQAVEDKEYKVIVFGPLDRETVDKHSVTIDCHDFGVPELTSSANFTVIIIDENDNAPKFTDDVYESSFLENNENGSTVVQVFARDADIGINSQVSYSLDVETSDLEVLESFSIDNKSGLITTNKVFDREERAKYEFIVYATDGGFPPLSSSATVSVTIEDVNDNQPQFKNLPYVYHIPESQLKETVLGKITAEDRDDGGNGYVSYSLVGNNSNLPFEVLPDGTLKTVDSFDREKIAHYDFQVLAIDNGIDIRRSNTANVTVFVTDINDNAPIISYPQDTNVVKYITYMMPADTQVMKIEATDADEGKNAELSYSIFKRNDTKMFRIGRNGEIYVARKLYETEVDSYFLEIVVSDNGTPVKRAWTKVTIDVLTKNVTAVGVRDPAIDKQNIIIAIIVVVVTVVIAAAILIIIWIVRRHDLQKRKFLGNRDVNHNGDNDSGFSSTGGRKSPEPIKPYKNGMVPSAPILPPMTIDRNDGKSKDVTFQDTVHVREKSMDSTMESNGESTVQLNRLASLRIHQAYIQNHNKPWTSQSELNDAGKECKKQEDLHSDLSADTATYDSGIGGSVSDTGDLRMSQLQLLVKQNGRRGKPPHKPSKPPRVIARGHSQSLDRPPERPPPLKHNPYRSKSPVQSPVHFSPPVSPSLYATSSPTPCSQNQASFFSTPSPTHFLDRQSPSKNVVQDLLMYKKFQNGLNLPNGRLTVDESVDTTHIDDGSSTSGSYYIDPTIEVEDWKNPPVSDIYV
ncbi:protocadherin-7-like [Ruditapes philippinarum]|uniref:protocadherin-7-like n=1 Tax=Ruditapes philippinarum TaxID=129788 RepID=UPI00295BE522|nr:protocadherin-7-like [Ruditapes philippinarum]XP_060565652.1 protocadherin-7-like [Ruditapes philippinarum]XP_060565653.1 protocadherin-7-like [Ruditapes philippinarum]XP_060565654.1 protocadherin-7-like [Ruditapes philippinarum]